MVKFVLPRRAADAKKSKVTTAVTMRGAPTMPAWADRAPMFKILIEFNIVEFDENSHRIRVDFIQKHRVNTNDSFKPLCYGLV